MADTIETKKVMVAIDESECSHYALKWALDNLGDTINTCHLIIFSAQPVSGYGFAYASACGAARTLSAPLIAIFVLNRYDPTVVESAPELIKSMAEKGKKFTSALLENAKDMCSKHGIDAETMTQVGNPKEAICNAVEKLKIDVLVVGSHSRGAIKRVFLGSVSSYCSQNAECSVLVVKKPV